MNYKFRFWNQEEKRFFYFTLQELLERHMAYRGSWDVKAMCGIKTMSTQCFDKNSKEIYEGDIVRLSYPNNGQTIEEYNVKFEKDKTLLYKNSYLIDKVEPSYGKVVFRINDYNSGFFIEKIRQGHIIWKTGKIDKIDFYDYMGIQFCWSDLEVIGNIFENKENYR